MRGNRQRVEEVRRFDLGQRESKFVRATGDHPVRGATWNISQISMCSVHPISFVWILFDLINTGLSGGMRSVRVPSRRQAGSACVAWSFVTRPGHLGVALEIGQRV